MRRHTYAEDLTPQQLLRVEAIAAEHETWAIEGEQQIRHAQYPYLADELAFRAAEHHNRAVELRRAVRLARAGHASDEQQDLLRKTLWIDDKLADAMRAAS